MLGRALTASRTLNHPWLMTFSHLIVGIVDEHRGNYLQAAAQFDESIAVARSSGDRIALAQALSHRGLVSWITGHPKNVPSRCSKRRWHCNAQLGIPRGVGDTLDQLSQITLEAGEWNAALVDRREPLPTPGDGRDEDHALVTRNHGATRPRRGESPRQGGTTLRRSIDATNVNRLPPPRTRANNLSPGRERTKTALGQTAFATEWSGGESLHSRQHRNSRSKSGVGVAPISTRIDAYTHRDADRTSLRIFLTDREIDVLQLLIEGLSDREIGDALFISPRTSKNTSPTSSTKWTSARAPPPRRWRFVRASSRLTREQRRSPGKMSRFASHPVIPSAPSVPASLWSCGKKGDFSRKRGGVLHRTGVGHRASLGRVPPPSLVGSVAEGCLRLDRATWSREVHALARVESEVGLALDAPGSYVCPGPARDRPLYGNAEIVDAIALAHKC